MTEAERKQRVVAAAGRVVAIWVREGACNPEMEEALERLNRALYTPDTAKRLGRRKTKR